MHRAFTRSRLAAVLLLSVLLPTSAQDDRKPYFSLTSNRTYAPGEKPAILMWSSNITSLEFRIYRVKDPIAFFQKLENVHSFGDAPPDRQPRQLTRIERFHRFKARTRNRIREAFRIQYTDTSREAIRTFLAERRPDAAPPPSPAAQFASLPLLNPQQVVSVWRHNITSKRRWESETIHIDVKEKGLYLVEAAHEDLRAYTVIIVSDLAVITKTAPGKVLAFVTNRASGAPVAKCPVLVWAGRRESARLTTDASGLAEAKLAGDTGEALVLARRGDDFAINSLSSWYLSSASSRFTTGYVYTDRPIYRPGHTVYFKAIIRNQTALGYRNPDIQEVPVEITDPEGKTVYRKDHRLSATGTVHGEWTIPATEALGYHPIMIHFGEAEANGAFWVEEYKKPEYEVRVTAEKRRILQGEPIRATISARYFFGEPVARAKVTYVVHRTRYWHPMYAGEEESDPEEGGEEYDRYAGEQIAEESGHLDADGKLNISFKPEDSAATWDLRYRIEARVMDEANREINGFGSVIATRGAFLVHISPQQYIYGPGERAGFDVEARDYDGNPVQTAFRVELRARDRGQVVAQAEGRTGAGGAARVELPAGDGGSMIVRAVARTPEGREVEDTAWIWVTGRMTDWYSGGRSERLQIIPGKRSYRPGDVAKVLIIAGLSGVNVLVTTEGRELLTRQTYITKGATLTVDVPIKPEHAPNFYIGASFVKDGKVWQGLKTINVPAADKQLRIDVQPSKPEFKPGEPAVYNVTAHDAAGKPASAEVSLGVVDEAIYALRPDTAQDIFRAFYGKAPNRVGTESSLNYYFHGEAGKRRMQLADIRKRTLAQLKPEQLVQPRVRKAFPDTAFWIANLTTDAAGRGVARFNFPDALTTWRATARAVTSDTKVGSTTQKTIVRKNLMLRLSTPRFLTQGDEVTLSVLVHNYLKNEKTVRVSLVAEGLELIEGAQRDVRIAAGAGVRIDWRARAGDARQAKLTGKALTGEESDAMEITLPVIPHGVKLSEARGGSVDTPTGEARAELVFPSSTVPSSRLIEIQVTPSVAGAVFGALEYLTTFPYGCTEQTMSSFLPNVIVSKAVTELKLPAKIQPDVLARKVKAGLDRLYDFQHDDGGWGWWQTDESHPFMSAYVVSGLAHAQREGYILRHGVLDKGVKWIRAQLDQNSKLTPDQRAYMIYAAVLAGAKDTAILDAGYSQRAKMTPYGAALLGLALAEAADARASEMVARLEQDVKADDREAAWRLDEDTLLMFHGDTTVEATAFAMKLLSRLKPESPLLPKAAVYLAGHRNEGYYWNSTKQTAMVVFGLTDYLKASKELKPDFAVTLWVNDKQIATRKFTEADGVSGAAPVFTIPAEDLAAAENRIRVAKSGEGRLYWSARAEYYSTETRLARTGSISLSLAREYHRLTPVKEGDRILYQLDPLGDAAVKPGDVIAVRLTLQGGNWNYLLIEDPIPAGAEFIERDDLYQLKNRPPWWQSAYARREFHDDHAALFQTWFNRGAAQHTYLLKVVNPGKFRVNPARVQPMYQPQFMATTEGKSLEVQQ